MLLVSIGLIALAAMPAAAAPKPVWDMKQLSRTPRTYDAPGFEEPGVRALFFEGPPLAGRPTRVFAYMGFPKLAPGKKAPGMVHIHGGGGTAFASWVRLWNERGYAAISMDTCGCVPRGTYGNWERHPDGGPAGWGGFDQVDLPVTDQWTYHAVAASVLAHSLLRAQPQVDASRIGLTGISWGGYLTCIVAGVDPRFRFAVPVYGCGFYDETIFAQMLGQYPPAQHKRWLDLWDASHYLPQARMPMLWVTGTNDFAYYFPALQKSYRLPRSPRTLAIRIRMPHGHGPAGEAPKEIWDYADSILKRGIPLPRITGQGRSGKDVWATFATRRKIVRAELTYTRDTGTWPERQWLSAPATVDGSRVTATLPEGTRVYYLNLFDDRDCVVSTEHEEL
jgi:dienelactone hydrolase